MANQSPSDSEIAVWPILSYWYGLTPDDLYKLERPILAEYARQLPSLIAEYQLMQVQAASVPHMKDTDRKRYIKDLQKTIRNRFDGGRQVRSEQEFKDNMAAIGIPIEVHNPEVT